MKRAIEDFSLFVAGAAFGMVVGVASLMFYISSKSACVGRACMFVYELGNLVK